MAHLLALSTLPIEEASAFYLAAFHAQCAVCKHRKSQAANVAISLASTGGERLGQQHFATTFALRELSFGIRADVAYAMGSVQRHILERQS